MEKTGKGVLDIAARIGQSKEYVYQRLKYSELIPEGKKVFLDGGITAGHAILIARVPREGDQKRALKFCAARWDGLRPSVRQLAEFIQRDIHLDLSQASFDLESDSLLPESGSCAKCSKRTKNSPQVVIPELLPPASTTDVEAGLDDDSYVENTDDCTDPACFNAKLSAHLVQVRTRLEAKGQSPVDVSAGYGKAPKGVLNRNAYCEVPKGADAKVAIVKDGINAGKIIHIKLLSEDRLAEAQKRKEEDDARNAKADRERQIRLKILGAIRAKAGARNLAKWEVGELITMVLENAHPPVPGLADLCGFRGLSVADNADAAATEVLIKALHTLSEVEMFRLATELPVMDDFEKFALFRNDPPKKLLDLARSYGVDAGKIRREMEDALKAAEGGTRREVQKSTSKAKKSPAVTNKAAAKKSLATKKSPVKKKPKTPAGKPKR